MGPKCTPLGHNHCHHLTASAFAECPTGGDVQQQTGDSGDSSAGGRSADSRPDLRPSHVAAEH